ncbi:beta/gamma crystallin-related protein [Caulobacter sp. 17J65-9]|uniref:beta/gamma crystallin-related protein n=1 Tax=Caulobacter sp. 17J65-9 TaxID=2709382 RepID=UPI0013CB2783|nr:beta/gamma crystallin-related protein [Caulobacter sp. 17J65-9]NEX92390.1 beta/gamma crystallin family protein [Caulobacter sp. 17J65-9]
MRSVLCFVAAAALGLSAPAAQAASFPNVPKMVSSAWTKVSTTVKRPFVKKNTAPLPTSTPATDPATETPTPPAAAATIGATTGTTTDATTTTPMVAPAPNAATALIIYSGKEWSGRQLKLTGDTPNLGAMEFNNRTRSVRVPAGETWEFCSDRAYRGHCLALTGEVADIKVYQMLERITSVRKLPKAPEA